MENYLARIRQGGDEAEQAALALGLLIEREKIRGAVQGDDGSVAALLGAEEASQRLSKAEIDEAVDGLTKYISETPLPNSRAVWAIGKSYNSGVLPCLIGLLDRVVADPEQEHLTYQALTGIINIGMPSEERATARRSIEMAAEQGYGEVKDTATEYLKLYPADLDAS